MTAAAGHLGLGDDCGRGARYRVYDRRCAVRERSARRLTRTHGRLLVGRAVAAAAGHLGLGNGCHRDTKLLLRAGGVPSVRAMPELFT